MQILLRLEKYHYRANFARGILESRNVTYDRSMRKLAKALPLDTPTTIELAPGNSIRVTLIDANHCIGAVMFLIEGDSKAIFYTGDIRAETWWVNSLVQNPVLLPFTLGSRRLDCMYLDTTFATKSKPYREFPSKAEGIKELLDKTEQYPDDTIFYFYSWTFGYENVWIALAAFLKSRIHLDEYRSRIYASLSTMDRTSLREAGLYVQSDNKHLRDSGLDVREATALCGFRNGNHIQPGCLTSHPDVRIHSCERGMGCPVMDHDTDARVVHIIPIITRTDGTEIAELGAGGGKGDLDQKEELETGDAVDVGKLMELCAKSINDAELLSKVLALLQQALQDGNGTIDLNLDLQKESQEEESDLSLQTLVSVLSSHAIKSQDQEERPNRTIRFPYSRHSSYSELCALVDAFKPKDVIPCTVDEEKWHPTSGMRYLFGSFCSEDIFRHDADMMTPYETRLERESNRKRENEESQQETQSSGANTTSPLVAKWLKMDETHKALDPNEKEGSVEFFTPVDIAGQSRPASPRIEDAEIPMASSLQLQPLTAPTSSPRFSRVPNFVSASTPALPATNISAPSTPVSAVDAALNATIERKPQITNKQIAYEAALGLGLTWADYGGLVSTRSKVDQEDEEL